MNNIPMGLISLISGRETKSQIAWVMVKLKNTFYCSWDKKLTKVKKKYRVFEEPV